MAWFGWAVAAAASVQLAPSPVYVALVLAITWVLVEAHAPEGPYRRAFPFLLAVGAVFGLTRVLIAALTTHNGTHVWFTIPQATMPDILGGFTLGGSVETDVVLQAATLAFTIVAIMGIFGAVNAIWSHYELVQATPRAFHELGVVVTVALAFIPSTIESVTAVREADRARTGNHVVRRGRLLRTILPVLERGLERAVALSESMDSRGFGIRGAARSERQAGWCAVLALGALAVGFLALVGRRSTLAVGCGIVGAVALLAGVWRASQGTPRQHYRRRRLAAADWAMIGVSALSPLLLAVAAGAGNDTLSWNASPLVWPRLDPLVAGALLPLLVPLVRLPRPAPVAREAPRRTRPEPAGVAP